MSRGGDCAVVVIAGNHDDPKRLSNANIFSDKFNIYLVGYIDEIYISNVNSDRNIYAYECGTGYIKFRKRDGEEAVVACLPYPSYYRYHESPKEGVELRDRIAEWLNYGTSHFEDGKVNMILAHLTTVGDNLNPENMPSYKQVKSLIDANLPYEKYPFATCELGGGIQVTHHRRPIIKPMDIYAVSLVKLGDGNNLVGYYMYHGGTNKIGKKSTFNESKATGYPNDYAILSYDFQAPLSEYGEVREHYGLLNLLHMFVQDFGEVFAPMEAVDAENSVAVDDISSLRYGMRTDGRRGFVFINHYQRLTDLKDIENVVIDTGTVEFPPINVKGDVSFFMPFNMDLGGKNLEYATAQPLCRQGDTYFFAEISGIKAEYKFTDEKANIVTIPFEQAKYMRKLSGTVYIGGGCDLYEENGKIYSAQDGEFECMRWNGSEFEKFTINQPLRETNVTIENIETAPFEPKYKEELQIGGERSLSWKKITVDGDYGFAEISYTGDTAQIYADGELVADDYYYGKPWRVPCRLLYGRECYLVVSEMKDDFYHEF